MSSTSTVPASEAVVAFDCVDARDVFDALVFFARDCLVAFFPEAGENAKKEHSDDRR